MTNVPPPSGGLTSNSNYLFANDCDFIDAPQLGISITQTIISNIGFSFQLNCWSPPGFSCIWQQYVVVLQPPLNSGATSDHAILYAWVNNWTSTGQLVNYMVPIRKFPSLSLPSGIGIKIILGTNSSSAVDTMTVELQMPGCSKPETTVISLIGLQGAEGGTIESQDLAPMTALSAKLVGPYGSETTDFQTAGGMFNYTSTGQLSALTRLPACVATIRTTGEKSNSVYGEVAAGSYTTISQTFGVMT